MRAKPKSSSPKADDEPLEPNSVNEGEAEVVVAEVEGEPLEPNSVDKVEAEVVVAEGRWRAPRAKLCR